MSVIPAAQAQPLDKVRFGTNWVAEAEHGGYFAAEGLELELEEFAAR